MSKTKLCTPRKGFWGMESTLGHTFYYAAKGIGNKVGVKWSVGEERVGRSFRLV